MFGAFESEHVALAMFLQCLYLFFLFFYREKYISGLALTTSSIEPIHCILLSLVLVGWIFQLLE
jgi:hypothetical protein